MYAKLRINLTKDMDMIGHNFHFNDLGTRLVSGFENNNLQTFIYSFDKDLSPVLRTKDDMIFAGVNNVMVRLIFDAEFFHGIIIPREEN